MVFSIDFYFLEYWIIVKNMKNSLKMLFYVWASNKKKYNKKYIFHKQFLNVFLFLN